MGSPPGVSTHGIWQVGHSGRVGPPGLALLGFPPWVGSPSQLRSQLESQDQAKKSHDPLLRASTGSVVMHAGAVDRTGAGGETDQLLSQLVVKLEVPWLRSV